MPYSPGAEAETTVTFTNEAGQPIDPDTIEVDLFDPNDVQVVDNGVPERISTGFYVYRHNLPGDAPIGLWHANWRAIVNGLNAFGDDYFEVLESGVIVEPSESILRGRLRAGLGEPKTDPEGDGSETFFDDDAITDLLSYASNNLELAILEGWRRKMARYARLVPVRESGSDREMDVKFKNATKMVAFWEKFLSESEMAVSLALHRVVGRPVSLRDEGDPLSLQTPFSGYSEHIRMYPTHRFLIPAILS